MRDFYSQNNRPDRREDNRPRGGKPRAPKTQQAINLGRLAKELDFDLLAAALGVPEKTLHNVVDGRELVMDERHKLVIEHRLYNMGIPTDWLDKPSAPLLPEYVEKLISRAAESTDKSAIRRRNFRKLVDAFQGRTAILADALEVVEPSVINICSGQLDLGHNRFSHLNMHLYQAGFPDAWLEQANAELTPDMVANLEAKAVDTYEMELSAMEEEYAHVAQLANATPTASVESEPVPEQKSVIAAITEETAVPKSPQPTPSFAIPVLKPTGAEQSSNNPLSKVPRSLVTEGGVSVRRRGRSGTPAAAEPVVTVMTPELIAPVSQEPSPAPTEASEPSAVQVQRTELAKSSKPERKKPVIRKAIRSSLTKEQSTKRAAALQKLMDGARYGLSATLWRDLMGFSQAYWGNIRRGPAKFNNDLASQVEELLNLPTGWLDAPTFPPATLAAWVVDENMARPRTRDEALRMAMEVATAPASSEHTATEAAPAKGGTKSVKLYAKQAAAPTVTLPTADAAVPPFSLAAPPAAPAPVEAAAPAPAPVPEKAPRNAPAEKPVAAAPAAVVETPAATPAVVDAPAPAPTAAAPSSGASVPATFAWRPAKNPEASGGPGPLTQALTTVLNRFAAEGKFTEDDAMRLLYFIMQQH